MRGSSASAITRSYPSASCAIAASQVRPRAASSPWRPSFARQAGESASWSRPLEATLWGEPPLGHVAARLADGTRIGWRRSDWSVTPQRPVSFLEQPG